MIRDKQTPGAERTLETMAEAVYNVKLDASVGYLVHEPTRSRISVYKPMGWFKRKMIAWCFGLKYERL